MLHDAGVLRHVFAVSLRLASLGLAGLLSLSPAQASPEERYGPFGPEGPRMREQLWMLPGGAPDIPLRATVFRPADGQEDAVRRPLAVINHGTADDTRLSVAMPVYYWLSRWFVERGYVVVLPQRRGHGATGGKLAEAVGSCLNPDHLKSGEIAADDIEGVVEFMSRQPFIEPNTTVVVGISTGGWASLALAARNPANVAAIVNFAGGRGGYAGGRPNAVCGERRLIEAAGTFGRTSRVPGLWLYSKNDSYFSPALASAMSSAWEAAGGQAELHILASYRNEGHDIANDQAGWRLWGATLDRFLLEHKLDPQAVATSNVQTDPGIVEPASMGAGQ
jgi:dienelactone hydrolase